MNHHFPNQGAREIACQASCCFNMVNKTHHQLIQIKNDRKRMQKEWNVKNQDSTSNRCMIEWKSAGNTTPKQYRRNYEIYTTTVTKRSATHSTTPPLFKPRSRLHNKKRELQYEDGNVDRVWCGSKTRCLCGTWCFCGTWCQGKKSQHGGCEGMLSLTCWKRRDGPYDNPQRITLLNISCMYIAKSSDITLCDSRKDQQDNLKNTEQKDKELCSCSYELCM